VLKLLSFSHLSSYLLQRYPKRSVSAILDAVFTSIPTDANVFYPNKSKDENIYQKQDDKITFE